MHTVGGPYPVGAPGPGVWWACLQGAHRGHGPMEVAGQACVGNVVGAMPLLCLPHRGFVL